MIAVIVVVAMVVVMAGVVTEKPKFFGVDPVPLVDPSSWWYNIAMSEPQWMVFTISRDYETAERFVFLSR